MRKTVFAALFLGGCVSIPKEPVLVETFSQPYGKLGTCVFQKAAERDGFVGMSYSDIQSAGRSVLQKSVQNTEFYEVSFSRIDDRSSSVSIRSFPTIWGADYHAQELLPLIKNCAGA